MTAENPVARHLTIDIQTQPDDETCGPTCLHAVYRYHGDAASLESVVDEVPRIATGGTLMPYLGLHALERGYRAKIYTYNLAIFDPTWFDAPASELPELLEAQARVKETPAMIRATAAWTRFVNAGGVVRFEELAPGLIRRYLSQGLPLIAGLSATYLYEEARERLHEGHWIHDPVKGLPVGHFVVAHGYDADSDTMLIADPYEDNPVATGSGSYRVGITRLLGAILLGVLSFDGDLLVIQPPEGPE